MRTEGFSHNSPILLDGIVVVPVEVFKTGTSGNSGHMPCPYQEHVIERISALHVVSCLRALNYSFIYSYIY